MNHNIVYVSSSLLVFYHLRAGARAVVVGSWKKRSKTCQVIRRRGRYYVIDKKNPRNKARQGGAKMKPWKKGK